METRYAVAGVRCTPVCRAPIDRRQPTPQIRSMREAIDKRRRGGGLWSAERTKPVSHRSASAAAASPTGCGIQPVQRRQGQAWGRARRSRRNTDQPGDGFSQNTLLILVACPRGRRRLTGAPMTAEGECFVALDDSGDVEDTVRALLVDVLGLKPGRVAKFDDETELFGALPEFDSLAVATLLTELEERLGILIEDEDVEAEDLMTFGRLVSLAQRLALN